MGFPESLERWKKSKDKTVPPSKFVYSEGSSSYTELGEIHRVRHVSQTGKVVLARCNAPAMLQRRDAAATPRHARQQDCELDRNPYTLNGSVPLNSFVSVSCCCCNSATHKSNGFLPGTWNTFAGVANVSKLRQGAVGQVDFIFQLNLGTNTVANLYNLNEDDSKKFIRSRNLLSREFCFVGEKLF